MSSLKEETWHAQHDQSYSEGMAEGINAISKGAERLGHVSCFHGGYLLRLLLCRCHVRDFGLSHRLFARLKLLFHFLQL